MRCWHYIDRAETTQTRKRDLNVIFETTFNTVIDVVDVDQVNACFTVLFSVYRGCSPLSCARGGT